MTDCEAKTVRLEFPSLKSEQYKHVFCVYFLNTIFKIPSIECCKLCDTNCACVTLIKSEVMFTTENLILPEFHLVCNFSIVITHCETALTSKIILSEVLLYSRK
jgi:hypothetical protein